MARSFLLSNVDPLATRPPPPHPHSPPPTPPPPPHTHPPPPTTTKNKKNYTDLKLVAVKINGEAAPVEAYELDSAKGLTLKSPPAGAP